MPKTEDTAQPTPEERAQAEATRQRKAIEAVVSEVRQGLERNLPLVAPLFGETQHLAPVARTLLAMQYSLERSDNNHKRIAKKIRRNTEGQKISL